MWPFSKRIRFTPKEIAALTKECIEELKAEGMDRTDWMLEALERMEKTNTDGQFYQSIRAELHRLGVRHSKAAT